MRIGIFGLGPVGQGLVQILRERAAAIEIGAVVDRSFTRKADGLSGISASTDKDLILKDKSIDTVVELMGGIDDALYVVRSAIENGKNVVTANKALLAEHGYALFQFAAEHGRTIAFEAAIAGAILIVRNIETIFRHERIKRLMGNAAQGELPDGRVAFTWKEQSRKAYSVAAGKYRKFLRKEER